MTHTGCKCTCVPLISLFCLPRAELCGALGEGTLGRAGGGQLVLAPKPFVEVQGQWDPLVPKPDLLPGCSDRGAMGEGSAISRRQQQDAPQGRLSLPQPRGLSPPRPRGDVGFKGTWWGKGARELPQTFLRAPWTIFHPHDHFLLPIYCCMANRALVEFLF